MTWLIVVALIVIGLTWLYGQQIQSFHGYRLPEGFVNYFDTAPIVWKGPDGVAPEMAVVDQPLPLADLLTPQPGLRSNRAEGCYCENRTRQMELGGQYVQRTNNYRRDYPDNCSAPLTEFVGAIYKPKNGVGLTVPCDGIC
jgi:hypothetical protein